MAEAVATLLLAGGRARRFPGKLEHEISGEPMIVRTYRRLAAMPWPVYVAAAGSYSRDVDAQLDAPFLIDRRPDRGPLGAIASACAAIPAARLFAVAADLPRFEGNVLARLLDAWQSGDEAVVPEHDGRLEPLAALYARSAILREAYALLRGGGAPMHRLLDRVALRRVPIEGGYFTNVNRPEDLREEALQ
jgi:molybdenum cofactor guanylyltransferase